MTQRNAHISSEWLRTHMDKVRKHHQDGVNAMPHMVNDKIHHGIVPDLINEILRLRGEPIEEFPWANYPDFKLNS